MPHGAVRYPFGNCRVCLDKATGVHYGVATCEGCKGFFKRSLAKHERYRCFNNGKCTFDRNDRNRCKACRFQRCLRVGMSLDGVKMGRIPKLDKERALEEERKRINGEPSNYVDQTKDSPLSDGNIQPLTETAAQSSSHHQPPTDLRCINDAPFVSKASHSDGGRVERADGRPFETLCNSSSKPSSSSNELSTWNNRNRDTYTAEKFNHSSPPDDAHKTTSVNSGFGQRLYGSDLQTAAVKPPTHHHTSAAGWNSGPERFTSLQIPSSGGKRLAQADSMPVQYPFDPVNDQLSNEAKLPKASISPGRLSPYSPTLICDLMDEVVHAGNLEKLERSLCDRAMQAAESGSESNQSGYGISSGAMRCSPTQWMIRSPPNTPWSTSPCPSENGRVQLPNKTFPLPNKSAFAPTDLLTSRSNHSLPSMPDWHEDDAIVGDDSMDVAAPCEAVTSTNAEQRYMKRDGSEPDYVSFDVNYPSRGTDNEVEVDLTNHNFNVPEIPMPDMKLTPQIRHLSSSDLVIVASGSANNQPDARQQEMDVILKWFSQLSRTFERRIGICRQLYEEEKKGNILPHRLNRIGNRPPTTEETRDFWKELMASISCSNHFILGLCVRMPGLSELTQQDRGILMESAYFEIWLIMLTKMFVDNDTLFRLPNGVRYSRQWMQTFLGEKFVSSIYTFADGLNDCRLTICELIVICAIQLTNAACKGLESPEKVRRLHNYYLDLLAYMVERSHFSTHSRLLIKIFQLLPQLGPIRIESSLVMNFNIDAPPAGGSTDAQDETDSEMLTAT